MHHPLRIDEKNDRVNNNRALTFLTCARVHMVSPHTYEGLWCDSNDSRAQFSIATLRKLRAFFIRFTSSYTYIGARNGTCSHPEHRQ